VTAPDLEAALVLATEAKARADAATEGPWFSGRQDMTSYDDMGQLKNVYGPHTYPHHTIPHTQVPVEVAQARGENCMADAPFIAAARTDVPMLADVVVQLVERVRELEHWNKQAQARCDREDDVMRSAADTLASELGCRLVTQFDCVAREVKS